MTTAVAGGCRTKSARMETGRMLDARWITDSKSRPTYALVCPCDIAATGAEMAELVLRHASQEGAVLLLFDAACLGQYIQRVLSSIGALTQPQSCATAGHPACNTFEPLTRKEACVLRLLAEGQSNSAMAANLCISDSTVRTHVRNISAKLNTHSRTQAVAMARKLGLITN